MGTRPHGGRFSTSGRRALSDVPPLRSPPYGLMARDLLVQLMAYQTDVGDGVVLPWIK